MKPILECRNLTSMERAFSMLDSLDIDPRARLSSLSRGTREKVQLVLVMSRQAGLYVLDEPLGGVDPAARDYILHTILTNYSEDASILISTHLIADIENILDRVLFLQKGHLALNASVDEIRGEGYLSWTQSPLLGSHILYNRFCAPVFHSGTHGCFSSHARIRKHGARHHEKLYRRYINAGRRNYSSHCFYCLCRHSLYHDKENQSALGI